MRRNQDPKNMKVKNIGKINYKIMIYTRITENNYPYQIKKLGQFFNEEITPRHNSFFQPHELTPYGFSQAIKGKTKDLYVFGEVDYKYVSYGLLRGWDEGYEIPSLGIMVGASYEGLGYGRRMMDYLHDYALNEGAKTVRLTVVKENFHAIELYKKYGYEITPHPSDESRYLGLLNL